jgi:plastocyanin
MKHPNFGLAAVSASQPTMSRLAAPLILVLALGAFGGARAASVEAQVRDLARNPVADAVVYAMPAAGPSEARGARAAIEQVDREFVPFVSVVQTGTAVSFPNRDPILHHVYSFSPAKTFEIKLYTGKSPGEIVFDKPGVVNIGCNIHDWMVAYILVVSTPYFAKTNDAGAARLRDLPAGAYELRVWHPRQNATPENRSLVLESSAAPTVTFAVDVQPRKAKYKPPLDRLKY